MFDLSKLHNLELYKTVDKQEMLCKLIEEVKEVEFELVVPQTTKCALASELLDCIQVCKGIAYTNGIDLNVGLDITDYTKTTNSVDELLCSLVSKAKLASKLFERKQLNELEVTLLTIKYICKRIAYTNGIDLNDYVEFHNAKLLTRGHKFTDK